MGLLLGYRTIVHDSGIGRSGIHVLPLCSNVIGPMVNVRPIEYGKARLNVLPCARMRVLRHGVERETRVFLM